MNYFGAIEAGGTKFACAIGKENGEIIKKLIVPTDKPEVTIPQIIDFFKKEKATPICGIGIACFGPLDVNEKSLTYGEITTTPKLAWKNFNIVKAFKKHFDLPIGFDTDVNGAALGEHFYGAAKGLDTFIYVTVGTGIGVGGMVRGNLMHGLIHPEMGHIIIPQRKDDDFIGVCPYHKNNCLEGLASGPSMHKRWKVDKLSTLEMSHIAWDLEAYYLAIAIANWIMCISPQIVIIGGGVMHYEHLLFKIRKDVQKILNGYLHSEKIVTDKINDYIVKPFLKDNSGITGAIALAKKALRQN
ncbi:MAG: ROK family protein [Parachlamydiales bacterium]|nr:ROK family protein [Parachlamydiales bacterium]